MNMMRDAAASGAAPSPLLFLTPVSLPTAPRIPRTLRRLLHHRHRRLPLVGNSHHTHRLRALVAGDLSTGGRCSTPVCLLEGHDDGGSEQSTDGLLSKEGTGQLFDSGPSWEPSRATGSNCSSVVRQLCEDKGSAEEEASVLGKMAERGLSPSLPAYNSFVHDLAMAGDIQGARDAIGRMGELGLAPVTETYHGLIRAYGKSRMYNEMSKCVRGMASESGCSPNEVTYNMLIAEYARGGLLERLEAAHRTLLSKRMNLLPSTLVVMLEAYADLGVLDKMERVYRRSRGSAAYLKEDLIRKMALVYIENYRFARLEEFANEIASRTGRTFMVWCLLLLGSALLSSRKGMESVVREMKIAKVRPHITFTNIIALAHVKMKDFRDLDLLLSRIGAVGIKPDLVTVGILFDACSNGFDGTRVLDVWRRNRFLEQAGEMNSDPLVIAAYGKGSFLRHCEEKFSALGPTARERETWTYVDLIRLVFSDGKR